MATPSRRVDTEQGSSAQLGPDAEPRIPQPLPQPDRRGSRMILAAVMLAAVAIIVLVVVL